MRQLLIALQFLTILPVRIKELIRGEDYRGVLAYFPLAGMVLGGIMAVPALLLGFLPSLALAAALVAAGTLITGGLHLDGLADSCDGIFSGGSRDRILEIMRDSRIGTFGAVGVAMVLILKVSFLAGFEHVVMVKMMVLALVFARWVQSFACAQFAYARTEGKANYFFQYASMKDAGVGGFFLMVMLIIFVGVKGVLIGISALVPVVLFLHCVNRRIQGMTGDTVGASSEIAEVSFLFFSLVFV